MKQIINQFRRIWSDDGRGDKDFTKQELAYRVAKQNLDKAIREFEIASLNLYNTLQRVN